MVNRSLCFVLFFQSEYKNLTLEFYWRNLLCSLKQKTIKPLRDWSLRRRCDWQSKFKLLWTWMKLNFIVHLKRGKHLSEKITPVTLIRIYWYYTVVHALSVKIVMLHQIKVWLHLRHQLKATSCSWWEFRKEWKPISQKKKKEKGLG